MQKNNPGPSNTVGSPAATAAIGNRWTQCRGSNFSPLACLLHVDAQVLKQAAEAAPSQTTLHRSCRFHIASPRAYNVDEWFQSRPSCSPSNLCKSEGITTG